ncbi:hypothetical protein BHM03_00045116 [Ensete ventricosum]|nr:hypothetical protein BHM03_00045116 [Ensete ventricosum]
MLILALIIILLCLNKHRKGSRFGHDSLVDGMLKDGLWDVYNNFSMGMCAEVCADHHSITREEQFDPVKLRKLRPSFKEKGGTVTAGNASIISGEKALELGLQVIAKIRGYADAAQVLRERHGKLGIAAVCNGGGGASALVFELV